LAFVIGDPSLSCILTVVTAPVRLSFFCVPYPTTTTSSKPASSISSNTSIELASPTSTSCDRKPIELKVNISPFSAEILNVPSSDVAVAAVVPFTDTLTPVRGFPSSSLTVPDISCCSSSDNPCNL